MARPLHQMTRACSSDSSTLSNVQVGRGGEEDSSSEQVPASTPPTSLAESSSAGSTTAAASAMHTVEEEGSSKRASRRARPSVNYNLKTLSDAQMDDNVAAGARSRNASGISGKTLVGGEEVEGHTQAAASESGTPIVERLEKALDMPWEIPDDLPPRPEPSGRATKRGAVQAGAKKVKQAVKNQAQVLGKRSRDIFEAGKEKLENGKRKLEERKEAKEKSKLEKQLDMGPKGLLDAFDLDALDEEPVAERPIKRTKKETKAPARTPAPLVAAATASGVATVRKGKKWQREGLYVGQSAYHAASHPRNKLQKKQKDRPNSSASNATLESTDTILQKNQPFLPLPMFNHLSAEKEHNFVIPFDIFAPISRKGDEKPKDWHQLNKNRLVGEAKTLWDKKARMARSLCECAAPGPDETGCDERCLNFVMNYECDDNNCSLTAAECGNRPFADLATRMKKAGPYDIGVEVIKTPNRGFGVRSCRTFAPGTIVMEYTGEIISEGECQRRMAEVYLNKPNYYLMEFNQGLIIDGTKGSMARFVNHSCAPNCEVKMLTVNGTPRMGVFAGPGGVMTGEELTYDYNFDNFGNTQQKCFCGAATCRGSLTKKLNKEEQKQRDMEKKESQRKAAEEAERNAEALIEAKKKKDGRGSNWRGWVTLAEAKEDLKKEKAEREEKEKNSSRALRLAKRKSGFGAESAVGTPAPEEKPMKRRKSSAKTLTEPPADISAAAPAPDIADEILVKQRRSTTKVMAADMPAHAQKSTIRRVSSESVPPMSEEAAATGRRASSTVERKTSTSSRKTSSTSVARPGHKRTHSALSGAGSKFTEDISPKLGRTSTSSTTHEVTRTKSEVSRSASIAEDPAVVTAPDITRGSDSAADEEEVSVAERPSKRRRMGEMVKGFFGGGKKGSANASGAGLGNGKLKQSTLSFAKMS